MNYHILKCNVYFNWVLVMVALAQHIAVQCVSSCRIGTVISRRDVRLKYVKPDRQWTIVYNVFGECHGPFTLKTYFGDIGKKSSHIVTAVKSYSNIHTFPVTMKRRCPGFPIHPSFHSF